MRIGTFEAKNRLSALLDMVEAGQEVTITRNGKPVARLVAAALDEDRKAKAREAVEWIRANRLPDALADIRIKDLIEEGRRI